MTKVPQALSGAPRPLSLPTRLPARTVWGRTFSDEPARSHPHHRPARLQPVAGAPGRPGGPPVHRTGLRVQRLQERRCVDALRHQPHLDRRSIFSIAIVMLGLSAAFGGTWMERNGPRKAMVARRRLLGRPASSSASLGVTPSQLWLVYLGYGFVGGIGLGIGYISPVSHADQVVPRPARPGHRPGDHGLRRRRDARLAADRRGCWRAYADVALGRDRAATMLDARRRSTASSMIARRRRHPRPPAGLEARGLGADRQEERARRPRPTSRRATRSGPRSSGCSGSCSSATSRRASASSSRPRR